MNGHLLVFLFSVLLIVLQFLSLYFKWKRENNFFYLVSVCSIVWGAIFYFMYGFRLDEGTVAIEEIPVYERGFQVTAVLLLTSSFTLVVNFFWKRKT